MSTLKQPFIILEPCLGADARVAFFWLVRGDVWCAWRHTGTILTNFIMYTVFHRTVGPKKSTARDLATRRDINVEKDGCSLKESTARIVATRHDARVEKGGCSLKSTARDLATRHEPARLVRPSKYKRKS